MRGVASTLLSLVAGVAVWGALVLPHELEDLTPSAFIRIPVEGLLVIALALVLRPWARRTTAALFGLVIGLTLIVKVLDVGFLLVLDRPFDPVNDWVYLGPSVGVLRDSVGAVGATASVVAVALAVGAVLTLLPLSVVRLSRLAASHRRPSLVAVTALGLVWMLCAVTGLQLSPGSPVASASAVGLVYDNVRHLRADLRDRRAFASLPAADRFTDAPAERLLTGLRGKDVVLVFVESYGRIAVQDSSFSPEVNRVLDAGSRQLGEVGFSARSAFLTSPTFGAASWLAHCTLQSGLWVDSQQRYNQLLSQRRLTLTGAFERAGWRTVFVLPAVKEGWRDGSWFYGYDKLYDAGDVGYDGPRFSWATMPDQYALAAFRRLELARRERPPVMAEVDLVSSHHPWTPVPDLVPWSEVGDGSVFYGMPKQGKSPAEVFRDPQDVRAVYAESLVYTLRSLISFVHTYPDPNLVMIVLGDHQPHRYVTGLNPGHDVPVTILAHDPAVIRRISGWGWHQGLRPRPDAPVWRMDTFRDRFLTTFGPR